MPAEPRGQDTRSGRRSGPTRGAAQQKLRPPAERWIATRNRLLAWPRPLEATRLHSCGRTAVQDGARPGADALVPAAGGDRARPLLDRWPGYPLPAQLPGLVSDVEGAVEQRVRVHPRDQARKLLIA